MESLSDDILGFILGRVSNVRDRKSCSEVCTLWYRIDALSRTHIRVLDPRHFPHILPRFPNLTTLVASSRVSDQSLMFIGQFCPNIRTLELVSSTTAKFGDDGLVAVARGCHRLVEVSLSSTDAGDKGIMALQTHAKSLAVLHLSFCYSITDASLAAIGDMRSISDLQLQDCANITDRGLNLLSSGPASRSLRVLMICHCKLITDAGVSHLKRMARLEELYLQGYNKIADVGGVAVSAISSLKKLDLSSLPYVSNETLFAVAQGCRRLVDINLYGCCGITGQGVVSLASSLPLERINISNLVGRSSYRVMQISELSSYHVMQIAEQCRSLKHMIVDSELKNGLSPFQREKPKSLCRVKWA